MNMDNGLFYRFLLWRDRHIPEKHFILIVSFLVGLCTAAAAIILKWLIHTIQHWLTGNFNLEEANYLYLLYPVIGILLAGLFVKYIVRDDISHGVTKILYAISQRKSRIKPHNTDRRGHRFQSGTAVPVGAADVDVACRLWCGRRDCWHL